jgi:hypothetical protein
MLYVSLKPPITFLYVPYGTFNKVLGGKLSYLSNDLPHLQKTINHFINFGFEVLFLKKCGEIYLHVKLKCMVGMVESHFATVHFTTLAGSGRALLHMTVTNQTFLLCVVCF